MMKKFSLWSIGFMVLGIVLLSFSHIFVNRVELVFLLGSLSCLIGIILSLLAIYKREEGVLKFVSFCSFFIVLFLISWFEPFQFIRALTWLKHVA